MKILSLNGAWEFHEESNSEWLPAEVPGCNFTDLMRAEKITDPFKGMNEQKAQHIATKNWEYMREFTLTSEMMKLPKIVLECDMLDTLAEVYINDTLVGKADNAHIKQVYDITNNVCKLTNKIRIKFLSPVNYIEKMQDSDPMPHSNNGITGTPHLRKPQCHMGWDWGPTLPLSGIVKDIRIVGYNNAQFGDFRVKQTHIESTVKLNISALTIGDSADTNVKVTLVNPNGEVEVSQIMISGEMEYLIKKPELWWPCDVSDVDKQPLYTVNLELLQGDKVIDKISKRIGLRTIVINNEADQWGENFQFVVNGLAIFAKGANWIPADSFINRFDRTKCDYFLSAMQDSNMNMVRVWGGGYYESDDFYDLCDEKGILVWQDFAFACAPYPFYNNDFLMNVKKEVAYNVRRLRHHASLALWCGNNEIEMMTIGWAMKRELVKYTEIFFHKELPVELAQHDNVTPYIVGSPTSSKGFLNKVNADDAGDTHLWHVWHGLQPLTYYRKRFTRFCSEFGLESLCDIKTIRGFAEEKDYSLKSDVFMAHQKCASGNSKMLYYMSTRFRLPRGFTDIVYLSQLIQSECVRDATEHWRRNRGRCNGSLFWQLNDCWPVTSWSSIDYEGRYKALQYSARHFNAPITVSLDDKAGKVKVFVINDKNEDFEGEVEVRLEDFKGTTVHSEKFSVAIAKASSVNVKDLDFRKLTKGSKGKDKVLVVELTDGDDTIVSRKTVLFAPEKKLHLLNPNLTYSVEVEKGIAYITVNAEKYARFVKIDVDGTYKPLSDNYFDMLAGEETIVTIPVGNMTAEEVEKAISVTSVNTVVPKSNAIGDWWVRTQVALTPINIANFIYYHFA